MTGNIIESLVNASTRMMSRGFHLAKRAKNASRGGKVITPTGWANVSGQTKTPGRSVAAFAVAHILMNHSTDGILNQQPM